MSGEVIVRFSKDTPTNIVKEYTTFKITKGKCQSYLDIHHPDLEMTDELLSRCVSIFNILLNYANGFEVDKTYVVMWHEENCWDMGADLPLSIFKKLYYNDDLHIVCTDPNVRNADIMELSLIDLLLNNNKYNLFIQHWTKLYNYTDLYNALKDASIKLLKNNGLPEEIIHIIFCFARDTYIDNEEFYIDNI
jgi:hypothetical protein